MRVKVFLIHIGDIIIHTDDSKNIVVFSVKNVVRE